MRYEVRHVDEKVENLRGAGKKSVKLREAGEVGVGCDSLLRSRQVEEDFARMDWLTRKKYRAGVIEEGRGEDNKQVRDLKNKDTRVIKRNSGRSSRCLR